MTDLAAAVRRSDLRRGMSAVADIVGSTTAPLRLALGTYGLEMVRGKLRLPHRRPRHLGIDRRDH